MKSQKTVHLMLLPLALGTILFSILPFFMSIWYSFLDWYGFRSPEFVGFQNYITLFNDNTFWHTVFNTLFLTAVTVPTSIFISAVIAVLLNTGVKFQKFYRIIYYLPVITMASASAIVFKYIFDYKYGIINSLLGTDIGWIGDPKFSWIVIALMIIWSALGMQILILLASLQNIPSHIYEASLIDGSGPIRTFFKITLPLISPQIFFLIITATISVMNLFDIVFLVIGDSPGISSTRTFMTYYYQTAFESTDKGLGSAIMVILFLILCIISVVNFKLQKKFVNSEVQ